MFARFAFNTALALSQVFDRLHGPARRRHIAACSAYGGKLCYEPAHPARRPSFYACERLLEAGCDRFEVERLRSGAALAEALFCQVREIRLLPSVEPRRTLAP